MVNVVIEIRSDSDFLLLSFSLMGSLSSFNYIKHYMLHHHLMQQSCSLCLRSTGKQSKRNKNIIWVPWSWIKTSDHFINRKHFSRKMEKKEFIRECMQLPIETFLERCKSQNVNWTTASFSLSQVSGLGSRGSSLHRGAS